MYNFFFFKQKTAYEMRISDWSSDVCSSDLKAGKSRKENQEREDRQQRGIGDMSGQFEGQAARHRPAGLIEHENRRPGHPPPPVLYPASWISAAQSLSCASPGSMKARIEASGVSKIGRAPV